MAIAALGIGGMVWGYVMSARRAEWSTCSVAAQVMSMRRLEQTRASKWDPFGYQRVDELVSSNFPTLTQPLDIPFIGTNRVLATNSVWISDLSVDPPIKVVRVQCVWSLMARGPFTNELITYRTPDR